MPSIISCSNCGVKLKLNTAPTPGKKIRCPKCSEIIDPSVRVKRAKPVVRSTDELDDEIDGDDPNPPRRKKRTASSSVRRPPTKSGIQPITVFAIAGGVTMLLFLVVVAVDGLPGSGKNGTKVAGNQSFKMAPTVSKGPAITDAECLVFSEQLDQAVANQNHSELQRLMNFEGLVGKSMQGIEMPQRERSAFVRGVKSVFPQWAAQIMSDASEGSYQRLHFLTGPNGIRQVLYRLNSESGMNYHKIDLVRNDNNQVVCGDFYIYVTGEYFSQTMRRIILPLAAHTNRSILERLTGTENVFVRNLDKFEQLTSMTGSGDAAGALRTYKSLPLELQQEKFMLLIRMAAAANVSEQEYLSAMTDLRKFYPDDVCLDMANIDFYMMKEQYEDCLAAIDRLDKAVGGDPALGFLRAPVLGLQGKYADARECLEPLKQNETLREEAYVTLLDITVGDNSHEETAEILQLLSDEYGYEWELEGSPDFEAFLASPAYKKWRAKQSFF